MAGHIQKVNFRLFVVSSLNVVLKANGSPCLIHDLGLLNKFVGRGPDIKHINLLSKTYQSIKFSQSFPTKPISVN